MPWYDGDCIRLAEHAEIDELFVKERVADALKQLRINTGRKYNSFDAAVAGGAEGALAAACALYQAILACDPPIVFDRERRLQGGMQQFRAAREINADRKANCLDMALFFAGCALRAGLEPVFLSCADVGEADGHAIVGLWLVEDGPRRNELRDLDGSVSVEVVADLLGADRFDDGEDYWEGILGTGMLVVDCSGAALGYPSSAGQTGLSFKGAVVRAWKTLTSTSFRIRCALDLAQARWKMPFPKGPRPRVVGREDDVDAVAAAAASRHVVLCGWLGVGKTALALQYAFEHRGEYPGGVFLLNAADQERALEQLAAFALESGIDPEWHRPRAAETRTNLVLASLWADKVSKPGSRVLLIIDDVADAGFITEPIDELLSLSGLKCRLLITTRNCHLLRDHQDFETIALAPLADRDATALLLSMLPPERRDEDAALRVCKRLTNIPLLLRVAGHTLSGSEAPSLREYEQKLAAEGFLPIAESNMPRDYPLITTVFSEAWEGLPQRAGGPREVLKLLSVLPRNESVPYELLALMASEAAPEDTRIELVRDAARDLNATGLAEQPEEGAVRIHPGVHEFAAIKAAETPGFVDQALQRAADRLHQQDFYRVRHDANLIQSGKQLRLLRGTAERNASLREVVGLFDAQLDYLRDGYDALAQLAMQAKINGSTELAQVLESVRLARPGPWFRLRWHGSHERGHGREAVGHSDAVSAVAIWSGSPDGKGATVAVSAAENGELIQWSLRPLELKRRLAGAGAPISGLCISPDGSTVYASSWDGSLRAVSLDGEDQRQSVVGRHAYPANDCAIDPDGRFVVSVSDDWTARVYSLPEGTLLRVLRHAECAPVLKCAVACDPKSRVPILITASRSGVVRAWNPLTGEEVAKELDILPGASQQPVHACALAPDGKLAAVSTRHEVLLWDPRTGEKTNLSTREQYVADCCFSPDGHRLMLVGRSKHVAIYRVDGGLMECRLGHWYHWLTACAFGADGRLLFASDDGSVHLWTYDRLPGNSHRDGLAYGRPNWVNVFRAGESNALSVSTDQTICCWHLLTGRRELTIQGHANWVNAFAVSFDGVRVLSGTDSGHVIYWSLTGGGEQLRLTGFRQRANACAISADGATGLAASEDKTLREWSLVGQFELRHHLTDGHRAAVITCAISPDGKLALSGGDDARVVLWNLETGTFERAFEEHGDRITATVFAHDQADTVLSSSWDGTVKCWNTQTGQLIMNFREHTDGVTACGSAAGGVAFSVSLDRTLRRWKLAGGGESDMRVHLGHRLRGLVVDPSGDMVLCSDMYGTVYLFDVMV